MDSEDDRKICDTIIIINIAASEEQNGEGEILEASMIETLKGGDNTTERDIDEGKLPVPARSGYPLKIRKYQFAPELVALIIILVWCLFVGFALLYHLSRVWQLHVCMSVCNSLYYVLVLNLILV